jgi:hypothetical protein
VKSIHVVAGSWYKDIYAPGYDKVQGVAWTSKNVDLLGNGGKATLAAIKEQIGAWYGAIKVPEDSAVTAFYESYAKKLAAVKPAIDAALPAPVFIAKAKDAKMEAAGKKGIEGKILKSGVMTTKWITTIDAVTKKPTERVKIGTIFYQRGEYCIYRSYSYKQYASKGAFGAGTIQDFADWMMRCK